MSTNFSFYRINDKRPFFLSVYSCRTFSICTKIVQPEVETLFPALSDRKLQHLILMLTIAMDRVTAGFI